MLAHDLLLPLFGLLTGFLLGALGSGGSILALPAFVYVAGMTVKSAVPTSLAVVGATSLLGALLAKRRCSTQGCPGQEVDIRVAGLFAGGGLIGSFVGARFAGYLTDQTQMLLFALVMLGAASGMILSRNRKESESVTHTKTPFWLIPVLGVGTGALTGVVGVGGGFLIVPTLTLLAGVNMKRAASTSLWIIAANSLMGIIGYLGHVPIAWGVAGLFFVASLAGMLLGQNVARTLQPQKMQVAFALFLLLLGGWTVTKTLWKPHTPSPQNTGTSKSA